MCCEEKAQKKKRAGFPISQGQIFSVGWEMSHHLKANSRSLERASRGNVSGISHKIEGSGILVGRASGAGKGVQWVGKVLSPASPRVIIPKHRARSNP